MCSLHIQKKNLNKDDFIITAYCKEKKNPVKTQII